MIQSNAIKFFGLFAVFILIVSFQNCSGDVKYGGQNESLETGTSPEYNAGGDGHEGKLSIPVDYVSALSENQTYPSFFALDALGLNQSIQNSGPILATHCRSENTVLNDGVDVVISSWPSTWPAGDETHDFDNSLPTGATFFRASTATAWVGNQLRTFAIDEPRFQTDIASGETSLMIEGKAKNFINYSSDFSDPLLWVPSGLNPLTPSTEQDPTLSGFATLLAEDTQDNVVRSVDRLSEHMGENRFYTFSVFVKNPNPGRNMAIKLKDLAGVEARCVLDFQNLKMALETTPDPNHSCHVDPLPNGWIRMGVSVFSHSLNGNMRTQMGLELRHPTDGALYSSTGHPGVLFWGAQYEEHNGMSSYIPTADTSFTREAETLDIPTSANLGVLSEGILKIHSQFSPQSQLRARLASGALVLGPDSTRMDVAGQSVTQNFIASSNSIATSFQVGSREASAFTDGNHIGKLSHSGTNISTMSFQAENSSPVLLSQIEIFNSLQSPEILSTQSLENPQSPQAVVTLGRGDERVQSRPVPVMVDGSGATLGQSHDFDLSPVQNQNASFDASLSDGTFIHVDVTCIDR